MRRRRQQLAFLALLTLAIVGPAASVRAQVPPAAPEQPPGTHKHDGFFARVRMGGGSLQTATRPSASGPVARRFAGSKAAMSMTLSFGGAIVENLILFGEVNQSLSLDGGSIEEMNPETSGNLWFALVPAGGVSYYLPWQNVYLSASFGLAHLSSESLFAETINSSAGWGASLVAGKEWWIWRDLGVGLAAEIRHARVRIPDEALMPDRQRCSATGFYLSASATYN